MLIIEWLMRLPRADGVLVVKRTATSVFSSSEAVSQAHGLWTPLRLRENQRPDGFQIVDQDGRVRVGPRFSEAGDLAG